MVEDSSMKSLFSFIHSIARNGLEISGRSFLVELRTDLKLLSILLMITFGDQLRENIIL